MGHIHKTLLTFRSNKQRGLAIKKIIFTVQESNQGGYEAQALGVSIFTEAETIEEIKEMIRDAVDCHFDEDDKDRPNQFCLIHGDAYEF